MYQNQCLISTFLFNVDMGQHVTTATHFLETQEIHDLAFHRFLTKFLGQIQNLLDIVHSLGQFSFAHFFHVETVLVCQHHAACKTFDRNDHSLSYICRHYFKSIFICKYFFCKIYFMYL